MNPGNAPCFGKSQGPQRGKGLNHSGGRIFEHGIGSSPHVEALIIIGAQSLTSQILCMLGLFDILGTGKGQNKHESIRAIGIHILGSSVPDILIEQKSITLVQQSIFSRLSIGRNFKGTVFQTQFFQILIGTDMRSGTHGRGSQILRRILEGNKERIGMQKGSRVQERRSEPIAIRMNALIFRTVQTRQGGYFQNGRIRSHNSFQCRFQNTAASHFLECSGQDGMIAGPNAETHARNFVPKDFVVPQLP